MKTDLIDCRNLPTDATVRQAFELLAGTFGMVITIVDERGILKGVVTDGDLRNALLNGKSIDDSLDEIMNTDPATINLDQLNSIKDIELLRTRLGDRGIEFDTYGNIFAIPVVEFNNRVKGLTTLELLDTRKASRTQEGRNNYKGMPRVLVIGGAGYIGSILVEKIIKKGWSVKVLDSLIYNQPGLDIFKDCKNFSFVNEDICNLNTQVDIIGGIDCVVFLAEIVGDPSCKYVPETALKTNYLAVNSMATLCSHMHINRFIYTSSCSVYGANVDPDVTLDEKSDLNPVSHYARMKIASEEAIFNQTNSLFAPTILRLGTVFGYSHRPRLDLVVNTFAKNAYSKGVLTVQGGDQWRPNVHVGDVADAIMRIIEAPINDVSRQVFNVGSDAGNSTIMDLAKLVVDVYPGCRVEIDGTSVDARNYRVNFSKMKERLGYEAQTTIRQGLEELKVAFEKQLISNLDSWDYSNIEALKEHFV